MKVGFVGPGLMGTGMAANLLKAGHELTVYNRTRAKLEPLSRSLASEGKPAPPCLRPRHLDWTAIGQLAAKDAGKAYD